MFRVTMRGVRGHLLRFLLTACAVMLGVSFVTGTYVLTDSIDATLKGLFKQSLAGVDVSVAGAPLPDSGQNGPSGQAGLPLALGDTIAALPGVARVAPDVQGIALIAGKDDLVVRNGGAPGFGFAFRADDPAFRLVAGTGPTGPDQVAVERTTLQRSGLKIGDTTRALIGQQTRQVKVTGEVVFGSLFGATAVLFDEATARAAFAPDGTVGSFSVTAKPGVTQQAVRDQVLKVLPAGATAKTGQQVDKEAQSQLKTALNFFNIFLLVFAGVSLLVGMFIIVNTFTMLIAQRTRELALLRALGAARRQLVGVVLGEAAVIGLIGSVMGVFLGVGISAGAKAALRFGVGVDIGGDLPVSISTVVISLLVGTVVTLVAALLPARRAIRISPVQALGDDQVAPPRSVRNRGMVGIALLAVGAGLLVFGVTRADPQWWFTGGGALLGVVGLIVASPLAAKPVVQALSAPLVALRGGVVARLARENATRVPRRTASTGSALMIGLALITGFAVLGASVKASVSDLVGQQLRSDFVLGSGQQPEVPLTLDPVVAALPQVQSTAMIELLPVQVGTTTLTGAATGGKGLGDNFVTTIKQGSMAAMQGTSVLLDDKVAAAHGWKLGDTITSDVGSMKAQSLKVVGIYQHSDGLQADLLLDSGHYASALPEAQRFAFGIYVKAKPGADLAALRTSLVAAAKPYLIVSVQDGKEYRNSAASGIDTMLNLLNVLLLFSVIVAALGIVNTLALSVFERTREIGLLRAVGMRRRQLTSMITIEAVLTAIYGAVLGVLLGLGLGIALQHAVATQGLTTLALPWGTIAVLVISSAVVGVLAAVFPAQRAARLDILGAISHA
jgi:putative ABC transport system permease protein